MLRWPVSGRRSRRDQSGCAAPSAGRCGSGPVRPPAGGPEAIAGLTKCPLRWRDSR